jgi:NADPH-dependent glutamate synthase beta subunit-like oxidoreductase
MSVRGTHVPEHLRLPIAGVTPPPTEKEGQRLFPTGNFRFYRPVYRDKTPPCNHACPTGEQIQKYLDHVKHDRYLDGYLTILEDNPMPSVTGRVCYHPCETACNRAAHDEPIGIRGVERFLGDFGLKLADNPVKQHLPPLNGKTVAIVGSGPGGLGCAYHLRRKGYASVIFEALDQPGGMLRAGIPAWHLPGEILDAEIAKLLDLGGIEIRCGVRVGTPDGPSLDDLARGHDAVFLALGQDVGRRLDAEGGQARGVIGALEFLRETGLGRPVQIGRDVLVVGGGNTASDAARSAIRLGGASGGSTGSRVSRGGGQATIVSLEAEDELLIQPEDLAQARDEGVRFRPNSALIRVLTDDDGNVRGAVLAGARLAKDENGTVRPEITADTEVEVPCDTILVAIGQVQVLDWLPADCAGRGLVRADDYGRLLRKGGTGGGSPPCAEVVGGGTVFTGGDVMRGPSMVVDALGDGKRAARDIDRVLGAEPLRPEDPVEVMPYEGLNTAYFRHAPRTEAPLAPAQARRASQVTEVTLAYSREQAVAEADRCMSCGVCNGCDNCYIVCPDVSVMRDARQNGHYSIRTHYCKGCLVCVQECPTGCLERVPELDFDEPGDVVRMETAFAPYEGAHAEQAPFTRQLIEDAIAEYDAARTTQSQPIHPNGPGDSP